MTSRGQALGSAAEEVVAFETPLGDVRTGDGMEPLKMLGYYARGRFGSATLMAHASERVVTCRPAALAVREVRSWYPRNAGRGH